MKSGLSPHAPAKDRRVRRSRSALLKATVDLVTERGTAAVPLSEIAETADVSRQLVYQHFGDRDTLLMEAALELLGSELQPRLEGAAGTRERALLVARHFAAHRGFYRAVCRSSAAFSLNRALTGLLLKAGREVVRHALGEGAEERDVEDLSLFLAGGGTAFVNTWLTEGEDPLDPEAFTERFMRLVASFDRTVRATAGKEG
jgi:AcrR family transcriptional regulator